MKHKLVVSVLAVAVVASLVFVGCVKPAPAPTPAPVEPIKLTFSHGVTVMTVSHKDIYVPWAEMIEERTAAIGKPVKITIFPAQALAKLPDQYDLVVSGGADIVGNWGPMHFEGRMPLLEVMQLPFLFPSAKVAALVAQELFETWPEIQDEMSEAKLLWFDPTNPCGINARTKQIKTLEDFKGLKANSTCGIQNEILEALGAIPVRMLPPDAYIALERGLLDVGLLDWGGVLAFKWLEVTKYRTDIPQGFYVNPLAVSMNWDTWNSLPPEVQEIFEELSGRYMSEFSGEAFGRAHMHFIDLIQEHDKKVGNPEIYILPEDESQRWVEAVTPMYEKWIADREAKGLPARAVFEDARRLAEKYSK